MSMPEKNGPDRRPYLILVAGRPGSGKTTLSELLSEAWGLPLLSRDRIKEGLVHTAGQSHAQMPDANPAATQAFFDLIGIYSDHGISLIAEAAFQHPVWERFLSPLLVRFRTYMLLCDPGAAMALRRYRDRSMRDPDRVRFHGPDAEGESLVSAWEEPHLPVPVIHVDTSSGYDPTIGELYGSIFGGQDPGI